MKKLLLGSILLALALVAPIPAMAEVNISIGFPLPPPVVFSAPPEVIVVPDAYGVYAVPDIDVDIFFWDGWWWRPWGGRWYRSHYYDRGWAYYNTVPYFYYDVDPGWRGYYRDRHWHGHRWDHERIPYERLHSNWKNWNTNRYWERQRTWGVQGYQPRPQKQRQELRHHRQEQYQQRPEVQRHQRERQEPRQQHRQKQYQQRPEVQRHQQEQQERQRQPQMQQHHQQQPQHERPQSQGQKHQGKSKHEKPQGKPERGDEGQRR